ncbi:probable RNA-directed DNA polymerase from transposon BS [Trichonephila clavipes]|nr:probable RNA-directed DNA polymerase from transposon BS [Trichonephila clavipes]
MSLEKKSLVYVALYHIHHIWHFRVRLRESGQPIGRLRKTCKKAFPRTILVSFGRLDTPIATDSSLNGVLGSVANHPLKKAEVIADSLQQQFEHNTEAENDRFTARTQRKIKRFLDTPTCLDLEKTTPGEHCIARNIIIPEQHGFVTQCSTVTQLLRVTELIHHGFQNNQATGMLFVDIAKAFDKIWHDGLLSKMMRLGFSDQRIKNIHSYLNSREFRVRVENSLSTPRPILSGVPQGSLLGPKLFNLYINDIPKAVGVHLAMYADDTAIFTQNIYNCNIIERLQNYVIRLETWLNDWKIKVNASKSACLLFTRQRCIGNLPHVNIFNQPVPWVAEYKYQG